MTTAAGDLRELHDVEHASLGGPGYTGDRYGLLDRLLKHAREQGGTLAFANGIQGSGKTTFMLLLALAAVRAGETVIWRGRRVDSWHAFPGDVKLWADHEVRLSRCGYEDDAEPQPWGDVPVHSFDGPADLVDRAERGCLNVVYAEDKRWKWVKVKKGRGEEAEEFQLVPTRFWGRLVHALANKPTTRWHQLFIDEAHEVWADRPEGDDYKHQGEVRDAFADFRKTFNSCVMASHEPDEVDYRILAKFQFRIYCRGAIPARRSAVEPGLTRALSPGEAILDSLYFAKVQYPKVPKPAFQVFVDPLTSAEDVRESLGVSA